MRNHFNVSGLEIGTQNSRQTATIYFAAVSEYRRDAESMLAKVLNAARACPMAEVVGFETETFHF